MLRIWTVLFLAISAAGSGRALAQPSQPERCKPENISAEITASGRVPSLRGCRLRDATAGVGMQDYRLTVEQRVASETIGSGRIVSQRGPGESGIVYVNVSTGPGHRQQAGGHDQPRHEDEGEGGGGRGLFGEFAQALIDAATQPPPPQPPAYQPPQPQAPPPPNPFGPIVAPPPPPPVQPATPQPAQLDPVPAAAPQPPPPPAPAPVSPEPAPDHATQVAQADPPPPKPAPAAAAQHVSPAPNPDVPLDAIAPPTPTPEPADPGANQDNVHNPPAPPPPHFWLQGGGSIRQGEAFVLTIRRQGDDGRSHRLKLTYSDPSLLASPPPAEHEFASGGSDTADLRFEASANLKGQGDHRLAITLASTDDAQVNEPASVTAVILDRTPWWKKLLDAISSVPIWVAALAAAGVAAAGAGMAKFLLPRATCTLGSASLSLGAPPPKSRWPSLSVDTILGEPSFSIAHPLPMGRRTDAPEPSPA
jgi:hypothetical protein